MYADNSFHCKCWQYLHSPCVVPGPRQLFGSQLFQQQQLQPTNNGCFISRGVAMVSVRFAKQLRIGRFQGASVLSGQLSTCYTHILGLRVWVGASFCLNSLWISHSTRISYPADPKLNREMLVLE